MLVACASQYPSLKQLDDTAIVGYSRRKVNVPDTSIRGHIPNLVVDQHLGLVSGLLCLP